MTVSHEGKIWQRTRKGNLVKHGPSGIYYLRARVGKKNAIRESLKTDVYEVAKTRLRRRMDELSAMRPPKGTKAPETLWQAMLKVKVRIESNPSLKPGAQKTYLHMIGLFKAKHATLPDTQLHKLTSAELETWWSGVAGYYAPATANFLRLLVRRALRFAHEDGAVPRNLGANIKRLRVPRTRLNLVTKEQFAALVAIVAALPHGKAGAEWIEFVAYTGTRPEEANAVRWEDIGEEFVHVTGGANGTKNHETRRVPIVPALRDLLQRIQTRTGATSGRVLTIKGPRKLLIHACEQLGIPRLRRYDFRHLFASRCNESGVDIPSIAKWLGHKDGGALAMKTYVHLESDHEKQSAAKVKF